MYFLFFTEHPVFSEYGVWGFFPDQINLESGLLTRCKFIAEILFRWLKSILVKLKD